MTNQYNEIKKILNNSKSVLEIDSYDQLLELLEKAEEESFYNRINLMLDNCDRIRNNVELIQSMSDSESGNKSTSGILYSRKIKLFLLGDFSSGKTTFIKRLLSKVVGVSSQFPQTSTIIRHFGSSSKMQVITPADEYSPPQELKIDFSKLIRRFGIEKFFIQKGDTWMKHDESITITDWLDAEIIDFMGAIDKYPGFITKIDWGHKISEKTKKYNLLDYADIYDVPGIGGETEHESIIAKAIDSSPDIIIYLIDPDRGIPGESEEKTLINIALKNHLSQFFWCYQKDSLNKSDNFIEEQEIQLQEFVTKMVSKLNASNADIQSLVKNYFQYARVIDAAGSVSDNFNAVEKVTNIISYFFLQKTTNYISTKKNELKDIPKSPDILSMNQPQQLIIDKLKELALENEVYSSQLESSLKDILEYTLSSEYSKSNGSKYAVHMMNKLKEVITLIVSKSLLTTESTKGFWTELLHGKENDNSNISCNFNFLKRGFKELYDNDPLLQVTLPMIQAHILYILFSDKRLGRIYVKDIESHIIKQIEQDLCLLEKSIGC